MSWPASSARGLPAIWLVLGGIVSVQAGAAIAKQLFDTISPTSMVWLRLASAAIIFGLGFRPRLAGRSGHDWAVAGLFGLMLVGMNWCIYQSFARIPLGMAVTLEFLGPLVLCLALSRRGRDLLWVALAALGVGLLGFTPRGLTWPGVAFALAAGACWAGYIVLSERTGRTWPGISGLAVASVVGAVGLAPAAVIEGGTGLWNPTVLLIGVAVGVLSSVIPYSLELVALRRMPRQVFGIVMSLEPAAAAVAALLVLGEQLSMWQWVAMGCVVSASVGAARSSRAVG